MTRSQRATRLARLAAGLGIAVATVLATAPAANAGYAPNRVSAPQDNAWGGYVAQGQSFTSISGSWVEPQVSCNTSNDVFAPWVGVDGYGSQTVEQTGVETNCQNGSPEYRPWYEMYPADPVYWNDSVNPGDNITGSVVDSGGGNYTITLTDNTAGWTETTQQSLQANDVSAEAVIESPSQSYPSFQELDFSNITVNGQVFDSYSPQGMPSGGYNPGPLSNGAFSLTPGGFGGWSRHHATVIQGGTIRY